MGPMVEVLRRAVGQNAASHSTLCSSRAVRTFGSAGLHKSSGTKLQAQRRHDEAEPLHRQALAGRRRLSRREASE